MRFPSCRTCDNRAVAVSAKPLPPLIRPFLASGLRRRLLGRAALMGLAAAAQLPLVRAQCRAASDTAHGSPAASTATDGAPQKFRVLRIAGDGRCMFRALAQGAHLAGQADAASLTAQEGAAGQQQQLLAAQEETESADALRHAVCDELLRRRDEISVFIDSDFDGYVASMRRPHVWGGEPELAMATHVLERPISVYSQDGAGLHLVSEYGEQDYKGRASVPLLFHSLGHYDLLVPAPAGQQPRSKL